MRHQRHGIPYDDKFTGAYFVRSLLRFPAVDNFRSNSWSRRSSMFDILSTNVTGTFGSNSIRSDAIGRFALATTRSVGEIEFLVCETLFRIALKNIDLTNYAAHSRAQSKSKISSVYVRGRGESGDNSSPSPPSSFSLDRFNLVRKVLVRVKEIGVNANLRLNHEIARFVRSRLTYTE